MHVSSTPQCEARLHASAATSVAKSKAASPSIVLGQLMSLALQLQGCIAGFRTQRLPCIIIVEHMLLGHPALWLNSICMYGPGGGPRGGGASLCTCRLCTACRGRAQGMPPIQDPCKCTRLTYSATQHTSTLELVRIATSGCFCHGVCWQYSTCCLYLQQVHQVQNKQLRHF